MASKKKEATLNDQFEMLTFVKDRMVTNDDLEDALAPIKTTQEEHTATLAEQSKTLARLDKSTDTDRNKRVDLDLRVTAIEKHLGIIKKIAA